MPIPFDEVIPMARPILFYHNPMTGKHQAAYRDGMWVDLEPDVYWTLWHGRVTR